MRSDDKEAATWLLNKGKKKILAVSMTKEGPSANSQTRMEAIRAAWSKIFWAHRDGEPNLRKFLEKFGPTLKRATVELPLITADALISKFQHANPPHQGLINGLIKSYNI